MDLNLTKAKQSKQSKISQLTKNNVYKYIYDNNNYFISIALLKTELQSAYLSLSLLLYVAWYYNYCIYSILITFLYNDDDDYHYY